MTDFPGHAKPIALNRETAWIWETKHGWSVRQGSYQIDLENVEQEAEKWHTVDWSNRAPAPGTFEGGLARREAGHLDRPAFLAIAEPLLIALRQKQSKA